MHPLKGVLCWLLSASPEKHRHSPPVSASRAQEVFPLLSLCLFTFNSTLLTFKCPSRTERLACRGNRSQKGAQRSPHYCPLGPTGPGSRLRHPTVALMLVLMMHFLISNCFGCKVPMAASHLWLFHKTMGRANLGEELGHQQASWWELAAIQSSDDKLQMWGDHFLSFAETLYFLSNVASAIIKDNIHAV